MKSITLYPTFTHRWEMGLKIETKKSVFQNKKVKKTFEVFGITIFFLSLFIFLFI